MPMPFQASGKLAVEDAVAFVVLSAGGLDLSQQEALADDLVEAWPETDWREVANRLNLRATDVPAEHWGYHTPTIERLARIVSSAFDGYRMRR